ncbi:MAG TPA: protein-disulfide reductase DsbD domain-containing protein [Vicinamibacterales bacterium]|nr:protein-disulfide reductase DsbD domain-containing protein [Vicinamibacterales bacterium]
MGNRVRLLAAAAAVAVLGLRPGAQSPPQVSSNLQGRTLSMSTDQLTVAATLAPLQLPPGGRVTLTAAVTPKAGMHVYAPGSRYRAVGIKLAATSPFRLEAPVEYPKPGLYTFKPLNEQVPAYDAPFRLIAQIVLDTSKPIVTPRRPLPVTLKASLDYQACDNRFCYLPESIPLQWTITSTP